MLTFSLFSLNQFFTSQELKKLYHNLVHKKPIFHDQSQFFVIDLFKSLCNSFLSNQSLSFSPVKVSDCLFLG